MSQSYDDISSWCPQFPVMSADQRPSFFNANVFSLHVDGEKGDIGEDENEGDVDDD